MIDLEIGMGRALAMAKAAALDGEVPVGAALYSENDELLSERGNAPIAHTDPTRHAEIAAIRAAAQRVGNYRLTGAQLFVTLEPCAMCAGAISLARVSRLVIAARDPKGGAVWHGARIFEHPTCHWRPEVMDGPFAEEAAALLQNFFRSRR